MCHPLEILIVCCSIECSQEENNLRLPLLRLIPAPRPLHLLCEHGTALGYRADGHLFGIPIFSGTPTECHEYRAGPDLVYQVCFSAPTSRETMAKAANARVRCAACAHRPHADMIPIANSGPDLRRTRRRGALAIQIDVRRIESAWTCCATRECLGEDGDGGLCKFRAAAMLSALENREAQVEQLRQIATTALAASNLADMANGRLAVERNDDIEARTMDAAHTLVDMAHGRLGGEQVTESEGHITVAGDCPGCEKSQYKCLEKNEAPMQ
ncbi:hypothetical protein CSOJ01_13248 [Colletotrichum sojae]|uniref:Uncharacterized protein n=1 Tax=Colletotrichum sojae TaxID=2175907 RepID=A0A8H6ITQ9_9PEZI|nr:hypothetical protein CSOJ01_13248 [Colletotrichum sojae]